MGNSIQNSQLQLVKNFDYKIVEKYKKRLRKLDQKSSFRRRFFWIAPRIINQIKHPKHHDYALQSTFQFVSLCSSLLLMKGAKIKRNNQFVLFRYF